MSNDSTMHKPSVHGAGADALSSHLRHTISAEGSRKSNLEDARSHVLTCAASINSSARTTPRETPAPTMGNDASRNFSPNASMALIGMRGTGKSTLAVIASIACRRRVVDIDDLFQEATGFSTAKYRKQFGAANHNLRQDELLESALESHDRGAIIVCNGGSLDRNGQLLMERFAEKHPVIYVTRDTHSICDYLGGIDHRKFKDLLAYTTPILRRCSNYEYANIAETSTVHATVPTGSAAVPTFLTLKRTERTFLKFLSQIMSSQDANRSTFPMSMIKPGYLLSDIPTELRRYTCAVQVSLAELLQKDVHIQQLEYGVDAFEILVAPDGSHEDQRAFDMSLSDDISTCASKLRRNIVTPMILHILPDGTMDNWQYLKYVHHCLRVAPDYITIDMSMGEEILAEIFKARGSSKIIGSLHAEHAWDEELFWMTAYDKAVRLGCALVQFSRPAEQIDEDFSLYRIRHSLNARHNPVPLACYNTGKAGRRSACFSQHLAPVVASSTQASAVYTNETQHSSQMPWVTARDVTQALYASFTFDAMQFYIIGKDLQYTVSPPMHSAAFRVCGLPHKLNRIQTDSLTSLKDLVRRPDFGGSVIIQPYKVEVISLIDYLSEHARTIGAINTLIPVRLPKPDNSVPSALELFQERNQSGPVKALYGENTEWIGIRSCIRRGLSPANAISPSTCGLVIGAGAMVRFVPLAC